MNKKRLGKVTEKEKIKIQTLFERMKSLKELGLTFASPMLSEEASKELKGKYSEDVKNTQEAYNNWWQEISNKYKWSINSGSWSIDFDSNEVFWLE